MTMVETKSRPIVLSAHEVRGVREGRKTQLRRVIEPQPTIVASRRKEERRTWHTEVTWKDSVHRYHGFSGLDDGDVQQLECFAEENCPIGRIGETLWVREEMLYTGDLKDFESVGFVYAADCGDYKLTRRVRKQCPASKLPRFWSRITLEVTAVRVERLQDIGETDAIAEGVEFELPAGAVPQNINYPKGFETWSGDKKDEWFKRAARAVYMAKCVGASNALQAFQDLWQPINRKKYPWSANPYVWCINFRLVAPTDRTKGT